MNSINCSKHIGLHSGDDLIPILSVFLQFKSNSFHVSFLSQVKMNSISWPASSTWALIHVGQLVEHCSTNAEAMGLNPDEAFKICFRLKVTIASIAITITMKTSPLPLYSLSSNELQITYW